MKIDARIPVTLTVERSDDDWWTVHVADTHGGDFACSSARTLHCALRGAVAYIDCAVEEAAGPFADPAAATGRGDDG